MSGWIRRISDFKFIVKNIPMSPSPSVRNKNKPSQCPPQKISSGDCATNPLLGLEKKNHHPPQVLEIEKKKDGCRPQVKYSTWDEIFRKTKRIDDVDDGEVDDMHTKQHTMMMSPSLSDPSQLSHSAVFKTGSSSVFKGSSSPVFNLVKNASDNNAKIDGFKSLKMHQGRDDASAINSSTAKANKTVSMISSTAKANKTVNAVPRKSATGHHQAAVPVLVRRKSKQHDSDSRHMQSKANKALIFPSKRPRNQHDHDNNGTGALNFKRRRTTLTSLGVKPKPAESPQTSANSCQTVVTGCRLGKKAVNDSSDASSVIKIPAADKQPKAVFKNAAAHSNTIGETSPQDDDCDIPSINDEDSYNKAKRRVEILTKFQQVILRPIADPEKTMAAHISLEKVVKYDEDRRAARIALEKVVKTVEFNDTNNGCMEELDRLINVRQFDLNFPPSAVPKPLERLGLYLFVYPDLQYHPSTDSTSSTCNIESKIVWQRFVLFSWEAFSSSV